MTNRKPLEWDDDGVVPVCMKCCDLLFSPWFTEAVHSIAIEHPGDPADMSRRTIEDYHARRHPAAEWGGL